MCILELHPCTFQPLSKRINDILRVNGCLVGCRRTAKHYLKRELCGITAADVLLQINGSLQWEDAYGSRVIDSVPLDCLVVSFKSDWEVRVLLNKGKNRILRTL